MKATEDPYHCADLLAPPPPGLSYSEEKVRAVKGSVFPGN